MRDHRQHERRGHKKRSPCAAEGEEKRDNTQGLEGKTCIYYTFNIQVACRDVKRILSDFFEDGRSLSYDATLLAAGAGYGILASDMGFPERMTIQSHTIPIVPRYVETDKGGVIHHSVYPIWFEMGRTELLRANGVAYRDLEAEGVFFVVAELRIKYRRPAFYDEELLLETTCSNVTAGKVEHLYRLTRKSTGLLLAEGSSVLACVKADGTIRRVPQFLFPSAQKPSTS